MAADLNFTPDAADLALLRALLADGSLSAKEAGEKAGLSQPVAWRRIRRMEEAGVIRRRRVALNREKLGYGVTVFLGVKLAAKGRSRAEEFERAALAIPEVQLIQHVLGVHDYRFRVVARDLVDFERIPPPHHDPAGDWCGGIECAALGRKIDTATDLTRWR